MSVWWLLHVIVGAVVGLFAAALVVLVVGAIGKRVRRHRERIDLPATVDPTAGQCPARPRRRARARARRQRTPSTRPPPPGSGSAR